MTTRTVVNCCARATSKELSRFLWLGTTVIKGCSTGIAAEIKQMKWFQFHVSFLSLWVFLVQGNDCMDVPCHTV